MNAQLKSKTDAFMGMEPLVCDVSRVASILIHMSTSENAIQGDELGWIGDQLFELGRELKGLYYKADRDAGTGNDGERPR